MICKAAQILGIIYLLSIFAGCAKLQYMDELLTLKSLADNKEVQERYLEKQEALFQNLLSDVKADKLAAGQSRLSIISRYGEPILVTKIDDDSAIKEELMYRHPAQLLNSEKVFLYFDGKNRLVKAVFSPAPNKD